MIKLKNLLKEDKVNESKWPGSVNDSKVESLRRELDKMEEKLRVMVTKYDKAKDNKKTIHDFHKQVERKRKEYNSPVLYKMMSILNEGKINEDRFVHKITALGNQIYIQLDKMEQLLSGKEKNNYMRARSKFWKITKTAMEDEEQK